MSKDNNNVLIAVAVVGFLYMRSKGALGVAPAYNGMRPGGVASMPASAGSGLQQIATGALAGFLQQIAKSPSNNTSAAVLGGAYYDPIQRGGILNEAVPETDYGYGSMPDYGYGYGNGEGLF